MGSIRCKGPIGAATHDPVIDRHTSARTRQPNPGPYCHSKDPSLLEKIGDVMLAWEIAKHRYAQKAIVRHAGEELYEVVKGIVPALLTALGGIVSTTVIGALVAGAVSGGTGAGAGAAAGFGIGLFLLEWLGLGFTVVYIAYRVGEVGKHIYTGAKMAWGVRQSGSVDQAAKEMADGIGVFFALLIKGIFAFATDKGVSSAISRATNSRLGVRFGEWMTAKLSLGGTLKAVAKPAGEYSFVADSQGRPIEAEGWLLKAEAPVNTRTHAEVTSGLDGYHAGHLIPRQYNGPSVKPNLVPTPGVTNVSYVKAIENLITRNMAEGPVYLKVTVRYAGPGKVPSTVRHQLYFLGETGMELVPGGDITTNLGIRPSGPLGAVTDPRTGKPIPPKDFLSPDPKKGVANDRPQ